MDAFRAEPSAGRVYPARRIVRSTDVTPSGRLRLDALARYLQIAAEDDLADSGLTEPVVWLVRRSGLVIRRLPTMGDRLAITTFCSGTGARWAERTTTLVTPDGESLVQACAVWTAVGRADGRPVPLSADFRRIYGPSAGERVVSVRLHHPRPGASDTSAAATVVSRDWPLRATDLDTAGHVNNAVHWAAVEDELAATDWLPAAAEMEYPRAIEPSAHPVATVQRSASETMVWLTDAGQVLASARLTR